MRKSDDNHTEEAYRGGKREQAIIMFNAVVVLLVVIVAMTVQLVRLNRQGTQGSAKAESKTADASAEPVLEMEVSTGTVQDEFPTVEKIRADLDGEKPMVALTFDDGPYDKVTDRLVKCFAENNARATFFVVGNRVPKYPDSLRKAYKHGNQIATHTFSHSDLSKMTRKGIREELDKAVRVMKEITGQEAAMLRPPYGSVNEKVRQEISMPMIYWCVDTEDWRNRNKKRILQRCESIRDGDIVLFHDLYPTTADAVEKLLPKLKEKGYQMVTVEELFYYKGIEAEPGKAYYSAK